MNPQAIGEQIFRYRTGVVLGALVGLFTGGIWGLIFGGFLGFQLERGIRSAKQMAPQLIFFRATFAVMGRIAKADGRVTEDEIAYARSVMDRMQLDESKRREAIEYFTEGKSPDFDLDPLLRPLAAVFRHRNDLRMIFFELQMAAAFADGEISDAERLVIVDICQRLGLKRDAIDALIRRMQAQSSFHQHWQGGAPTQQRIDEAYGVLGVDASATDAQVKRAWRKLMSQHHPDKLVSKGLPEEMMQLAKEKAQEIQTAYDLIREVRKAS
ncbi:MULTISPECIES: co-chaperone DjlA [unclassified Marinobacterium]|jgi:DnaJ like chaperone protein|uniref:co-chaperone DjlA n=1 Tax=unclassified Marinobacterium TaxID=2644139 RepID=UPI00156877E3|nr:MULTISPECIES: co-chaperone DjlA [unclassified Marinobacterium]NRP57392.1 DnaJ-like protein DjlA [Marinobacterium sp. xm-d-510]NRP97904.1 DnaJ-like protein DjlA [Marinobacterium sp. xm-a-127]